MEKKITIALAGNPNAGKTSLFNNLTGARAHVGNYPGVTVEKKEGTLHHKGSAVHVVDLPGTYSLTAYSLEELVARNYILDERPDLVVDVVDASNLERNLYLAVQFMEIGIPVVIALNMMDVAEHLGIKIDLDKLQSLLGVPVVPTVARSGRGLDKLLDAVVQEAARDREWAPKRIRYGADLDVRIKEIAELLDRGRFDTAKFPSRWLAIKALEGDEEVHRIIAADGGQGRKIIESVEEVSRHLRSTVDDEPEGVIADHRYGYINSIVKQAVFSDSDLRRTISDKLDMVILNRLLGPLILLAILYFIYQFVFLFSETPVAWFEMFFGWLGDAVSGIIPEGPVQSMVVSGVIDGVGGVLGFVPLIALMFFAIAILEDSGYMARIAFIMDRVLRTFGLHGNSILALIVGGGISGGCAVPGVMAARTLRDPKERLATILVTPFMNCGAKLPVYAVLIAAFFAEYKAQMLFILTIIAWTMALIAARILRWTVLKGVHTPFVMELPPYRLPTLKGLLIHTWERVWQYIKKAGTVILAISILIWAMMTYPQMPESQVKVFDHQRAQIENVFNASPAAEILRDEKAMKTFDAALSDFRENGRAGAFEPGPKALAEAVSVLEKGEMLEAGLLDYKNAAEAWLAKKEQTTLLNEGLNNAMLRHTVGGRIGTALETVSRPLGFDWRTNIALTGGFAAKEVVVATLGTAYSLGEKAEDETSLAQRLKAEPSWNPLTAFTLMLFVMMYAPCFVTIVVIAREAGWKWAAFSMCYSTGIAYLAAFAVATAGKAIGIGL